MRHDVSIERSPFEGCKKIYVYCPGNSVSGGPELLHQLVSELVMNKVPASIVYYPGDKTWSTPEPYLRYDCPIERRVPDDKDIAVIVPEVATDLLNKFSLARRCIWWLSVDNYSGNLEGRHMATLLVKRCISSRIMSPKSTIHLCQSLYSKQFIKRRFGVTGYPLSDYLSDEFFSVGSPVIRQDIVAYNPKKGVRTTNAIVNKATGITFVPLVNMRRDQIRSALQKAKVYIDFGCHPGKDRIPREAAISGCVVIVGKRGSAKNDYDVGIPSDYKFMPWQHKKTIAMIRRIFSDHLSHLKAQDSYRYQILTERDKFATQVQCLFSCCSAMMPTVQGDRNG